MSDFSRQDPYQPTDQGYTGQDSGTESTHADDPFRTDDFSGQSGSTDNSGGIADTAKVKAETAKDEAGQVGQDAKDATQYVAGLAKDEAKNVASEAGTQARQLFTQAKSDLEGQASSQQDRLAGMLREAAEDLQGLLSGQPVNTQGLVSSVASQAQGSVNQVAQFLEGNDPQAVLNEVRRFARRRPGAFLAIAAGVGLLAGRMTRGMTTDEPTVGSDARGFAATDVAQGYNPGYEYTETTTAYPQTTTYPQTTAQDPDAYLHTSSSVQPGYQGESYQGQDQGYQGQTQGYPQTQGGYPPAGPDFGEQRDYGQQNFGQPDEFGQGQQNPGQGGDRW